VKPSAFDPLLQELARKDFLTYQHSIAVAEHMRHLAQAMKLTEVEVEEAALLGSIHDLGKIKVPAEIYKKLQAGEKLDDKERQYLCQQPDDLFAVVSRKLLSQNLQHAIEHINCQFNGRGEPSDAGDEIHLFSRMLTITSYYDMLTRQRTGRAPLREEQSRQVLVNNSDKLFDSAIVKIFLHLLSSQ